MRVGGKDFNKVRRVQDSRYKMAWNDELKRDVEMMRERIHGNCTFRRIIS